MENKWAPANLTSCKPLWRCWKINQMTSVLYQFPVGYQELIYPYIHQSLAESWIVPFSEVTLFLYANSERKLQSGFSHIDRGQPQKDQSALMNA